MCESKRASASDDVLVAHLASDVISPCLPNLLVVISERARANSPLKVNASYPGYHYCSLHRYLMIGRRALSDG